MQLDSSYLKKKSKTKNIFSSQNLFKNFKDYEIDFSECLKSVNIRNINFTNYFRSSKDNLYKAVKRLVKTSSEITEEDFVLTEYTDENDSKNYRIKCILEETRKKRISELPMLYKFKYIPNPAIQFFVKKSDYVLLVVFIDIYHLAIPAPNFELGETVENSRLNYLRCKDYDYGLENIVDSKKKKLTPIHS